MDVTGTVHGLDYAKNMAGWLKEEGFENVKDEHVDVDIGARCKDPDWGARCAKVLVESFTGVVGACKSESNPLFHHAACSLITVIVAGLPPSLQTSDERRPSPSILERLPERAEEEMLKSGGSYPPIFASGQKAAA